MNPAITAAGPRLNADVFFARDPLPPDTPGHPPVPDPTGSPGPRTSLMAALLSNRLDALALNPQPLPPRESSSPSQSPGKAMLDFDWCGTVPRRFPIPPPPPGPWGDLVQHALGR